MQEFVIRKVVRTDFDKTLAALPEALKTEGFGVLTEIDVRATLKNKIGVNFRRYRIMGACNPTLAHQALSTLLEVGVMLPCNVVVYEDDEGKTVVCGIDPTRTIASVGVPQLQPFAQQVKEKLARAINLLE